MRIFLITAVMVILNYHNPAFSTHYNEEQMPPRKVIITNKAQFDELKADENCFSADLTGVSEEFLVDGSIFQKLPNLTDLILIGASQNMTAIFEHCGGIKNLSIFMAEINR